MGVTARENRSLLMKPDSICKVDSVIEGCPGRVA